MKKTLRLSLLSMLFMLCGGMAWADEVTISASDLEGAIESSKTVSGVTFSAKKNNGSTAPSLNKNDFDLRIYAKGTLTISAQKNITKMVFNVSTQGLKRLAPITASVGSIATQAKGDETVTWTGEAQEIVLTVGEKAEFGSDGSSKAGQLDFSSVTITFGEDGPVVETVSAPVFSPKGGEFEESIEVTLSCATEGATILYAVDDPTAAPQFTEYDGAITLTETTTLMAKAVKGDLESSVVSATFTKKEPVIEPEAQKVNVTEALEVIAQMEDKAQTEEWYEVTGYIVAVTEVSTSFGNASYLISDKAGDTANALTVYRGYYLNNEKFTAADQIGLGDKVVVRGQLLRYVNKSGEMTPELAQGNYIISIEKSEVPVEPEYEKVNVAEALEVIAQMEDGAKSTKTYEITGYVVEITEISVEHGNGTYLISDKTDDTENTLTVFRGKFLNGVDFTSVDEIGVGDKVVVRGLLQRYVKDQVMTPEVAQGNYIVSIEKADITDGINEVKAGANGAAIYSLQGQRMVNAQKGLYIVNGKKVVMK